MHWRNLIKSARLCSQSDFECHVGWSGHNAYIRVALVEGDLNGHTVRLWNRIILSPGNHPPECWHSGMAEDRRKQHEHQKYCFNRSSGREEEHRKRGGAGWAQGDSCAWRNRWCMETFRAAQTRKAALSPTLIFSHKSAGLLLIDKIMNCSHWLTYHT